MNRAVGLSLALLCLIAAAFAVPLLWAAAPSAEASSAPSVAPSVAPTDALEFAPVAEAAARAIPRTIWSFWDGPRDELVDLCVDSWRLLNPGYEVVLLDKESVRRYLPDFRPPREDVSQQKFSDFLRLDLLATHGGVWADASMLCVEPLDEWIGARSFCGFTADFTGRETGVPVIESWFIASAPDAFMRRWRDVFFELETGDAAANIAEWERRGVDRQGIDVPYLAIHFAAQVVLQREGRPGMTLYRAADTAFKYLGEADWDSGRAVEALADGAGPLPGRYALKLRGAERGAIGQADGRVRDRLMRRLRDAVAAAAKAVPKAVF